MAARVAAGLSSVDTATVGQHRGADRSLHGVGTAREHAQASAGSSRKTSKRLSRLRSTSGSVQGLAWRFANGCKPSFNASLVLQSVAKQSAGNDDLLISQHAVHGLTEVQRCSAHTEHWRLTGCRDTEQEALQAGLARGAIGPERLSDARRTLPAPTCPPQLRSTFDQNFDQHVSQNQEYQLVRQPSTMFAAMVCFDVCVPLHNRKFSRR